MLRNMSLLFYMLVAVLMPNCYGEESVFLTVLNPNPLNANANYPKYQCYRTNGETVTRTYGRYLRTRGGSGDTLNLPPNPPTAHCCESAAHIINLPTTNSNGFGAFYCRGEQTNRADTTVPTFLLRSDAKLHPKGGFFTKTVNVGDRNVVLEAERVNGDRTNLRIFWRFNNSVTAMNGGYNSLTYTINEVSKQHEGVYEINYEGERNNARHALMRLIVRDCPANRWGPPGCYGICDKCYNGGVCDPRSGKCICPPGFRGDNCLTGCGGNKFGKNCEFGCSRKGGQDACSHPNFCLPDPYGCTCNTGFMSLGCRISCGPNKFGAGCTQDCRCISGSCNSYTGQCQGSNNQCLQGWSGASCQIPTDTCEPDYYGPQCTDKCHCLNDALCDKYTGECPGQQCAPGYKVYDDGNNCQECRGSTYGFECTGVCNCVVDSCDKVSGTCNGNCLSNWVLPDCRTGIESLTNTKVNPNQETVFTCRVTGNPLPAREMVILERLGGTTTGITFKSTSVSMDGATRSVQFDVNTVSTSEKMVCRLGLGFGLEAYQQIQANTFVLPELNAPPRVTDIGGLWAEIEWDEWNNDTNVGDAPVVAYRVHYRTIDTSSWTSMDITGNGLTTKISNLRWETPYIFSISAVRAGTGGEGPRGPPSYQVYTTCAEPAKPKNLMAYTHHSAPKQIMLEWQEPGANDIRCSSGLQDLTIYYRNKHERSDTVIIVGPNMKSANLTGLETFTDYMIQMSMRNDVGVSDKSEPIHYYSPEEEPPAPMKPNITMTTLTSITVLLRAAEPYNLNGFVRSYEVEYQRMLPLKGDYQINSIPASPLEFSVERIIQNLTENSNYSIRVQVENRVGISQWSKPVYAMTINRESGKQTGSLGAGGTVGVVVSILILIILIAVFIVVILRKRESQKRVPPITYAGSAHGQTNATFDNSVIDLTVPEPGKKPDRFVRNNDEENMYANAAVINQVNNHDHVMERPRKELPQAHNKATENKIPVATVLPSRNPTLTSPQKKREIKEEPSMYENFSLSGHAPIPVTELEGYVMEGKKTDSLKHEYALIPKDRTKSWEIASKQENKPKNRFKNIIAYDHSRVILEPIAGDPHSDYYNACYIQNHKEEKSFIAAQGPNSASLNDFWRMIWQEQVGTIVMVTQLVENGKARLQRKSRAKYLYPAPLSRCSSREKCRKYWPELEGHSEVFGNLQVTLLDTEFFSDYSIRTMRVQQVNGEDIRSVKQYSFFSWPDMGVPLYPTAVLQFVRAVKSEYNRQHMHKAGNTPILVHCSAGVGRTGTFISIYTQLEMMKLQKTIDVFNFVKKMRESRVNMVQTAEQYMFVYNSLLEAYLSGNTAIPVSEYSERVMKMKRINNISRKTYIEEEFKTLKSISPLPDAEMFRGGRLPENDDKNRYPSILPMERNRPFLIVEGMPGSTNYINAAFVDSFKKKDAFITTQMPLPNTMADIWRMAWDWKCPAIVMLNDIEESDQTCEQYWPEDYGSLTFGPLVIESESSESNDYFITRKLKLTNIYEPSSPVLMTQFHLQGWPCNQDKPDSPLCLLTLLDALENWQKEAKNKGPAIIQCMNGIGRSGVFCTISTVREKLKRDNVVDIFQSIKRLRMNHPKMVETLNEYVLIYEAMQEFFTQFDDYANFR